MKKSCLKSMAVIIAACLLTLSGCGKSDGNSAGSSLDTFNNAVGSHFVIYKNPADEEGFSMRTCLPVSDYNGDDSIEVFEEKCLHIRFTEGFSKVATAHILIKEYAEENRISCADKVYEVYNRDMSVDVYQVLV